MTVEELVLVVGEVKHDFEREEDQGLLQRDLHKAEQALAGKYACDRILRAIEARNHGLVIHARMSSRAR